MDVTLQPMSPERYAVWNEHVVAEFAREQVESGNWAADDALERSVADNATSLPQGLDTPGHDIFVGLVDDEEVGVLWLFTNPALKVADTWIYDIEVSESHRGKGHGRGLIDAAERWCSDQGIATLRLNVHAFNTPAVRLYESTGFVPTNTNMMKKLT